LIIPWASRDFIVKDAIKYPVPLLDTKSKMADVEKAPLEADQNSNPTEVSAKERAEAFVAPTPKEEKDIIRKLDFHIMPIVFILATWAMRDLREWRMVRYSLPFPLLESPLMILDIDLSGFRYNWLGTIFYIAYIFSQWLLMGWKQFPPLVLFYADVLQRSHVLMACLMQTYLVRLSGPLLGICCHHPGRCGQLVWSYGMPVFLGCS